MTVRAEVPIIEYEGNGVTDRFPFTWSFGDLNDNYVELNGTLLTEGIEYELLDGEPDYGGIMWFREIPQTGDIIKIYRDTPVTQEVEYEESQPFPAETHERQMDKDTRILQEVIEGGRAAGGTVDLSADQQETYVDIINSSGTDARIETWTVDGLKSGVAMGEVIPFGGTAPQDTAPTAKKDGYLWWVLGAAASAGGDASITLWTAALSVTSVTTSPAPARAEFAYDASTGDIGYGYDQTLPLEEPAWQVQQAFANPITVPSTYLIMMEWVNGPIPSGSATDTWLDATADASWYVTDGQFIGIVHAAPDAGGGVPDETKKVSRYVTLSAEMT